MWVRDNDLSLPSIITRMKTQFERAMGSTDTPGDYTHNYKTTLSHRPVVYSERKKNMKTYLTVGCKLQKKQQKQLFLERMPLHPIIVLPWSINRQRAKAFTWQKDLTKRDALPKKAVTRETEDRRNEVHTEKTQRECAPWETYWLLIIIYRFKTRQDLQIDMIVPLSDSCPLSPPLNPSLSLLPLCLSPLSVSVWLPTC